MVMISPQNFALSPTAVDVCANFVFTRPNDCRITCTIFIRFNLKRKCLWNQPFFHNCLFPATPVWVTFLNGNLNWFFTVIKWYPRTKKDKKQQQKNKFNCCCDWDKHMLDVELESYKHDIESGSLIAKFLGPTWGPPGSCWPQVGPM